MVDNSSQIANIQFRFCTQIKDNGCLHKKLQTCEVQGVGEGTPQDL